jgi:hypothetical protein
MEVRAILERGRAPLGLRAAPFFIAHPTIRNARKCIGVQQTDVRRTCGVGGVDQLGGDDTSWGVSRW